MGLINKNLFTRLPELDMKINSIHKTLLAVVALALIQTCTCPTFSAACNTNEDCVKIYNSFYQCNTNKKCGHQPLFPPNPEYIVGFALIVIISALANAGGL